MGKAILNMPALVSICLLAATWLLLGAEAEAEVAYPMLMSLRPVAVQVGTSAEVTIKSRYTMHGAYQVLVSGEGVAGEIVPPEMKQEEVAKKPNVERLTVRFIAAADARPGVRDVRVATPQGVSTVGQLVIVRDPVVVEASNNDQPALAQPISLPAVVCGAIEKNEDVDFYRFHAEAGQALVFQVRCARLQDRIHDLQTHADPIVTLRSGAGATIGSADNTTYFADPILSHRFAESGDYLLEIRDVRYQGNQYWEYCLEISDRPLVENTFPLAMRGGRPVTLQAQGHLVGADARVTWMPPAERLQGLTWVELPLAGKAVGPVPLVIADVPLFEETAEENETAGAAQPIGVPGGVNGRLEREGDIDCFSFAAKKGEAFSVELIARRARSALDSHLRLLDEAGKQLALNDDLRLGKRGFTDSWIENWTAPADGTYVIEVRDVHLRGGGEFPYFVKVTRCQPYFELYLDADKTQIVPGGCAAIFVRADRKNGFAGEIQLAVDGLPPGVVAHCGRILADKGQDGCIVLEAGSDAKPTVSNVVVSGRGTHRAGDGQEIPLAAVALPYQETYQPGGGRGHWPVASHAVAVSEPADIRGIQLSSYDIRLKPGESQKIEVTIERSPGFIANVSLDMLMRHLNSTYANTLPTGVTLNDKEAKSLLAGSATQGYLSLTAAKDAPPVEKQQAVVMAHVALNFVMKWTYASSPVTITVETAGR